MLAPRVSRACALRCADEWFEVYNYGTVTTSRIEFYFVADASPARLTALGLKAWPVDTKLKAAGRPTRQPLPLKAFRERRARVDARLREQGDATLPLAEFIAARLYSALRPPPRISREDEGERLPTRNVERPRLLICPCAQPGQCT